MRPIQKAAILGRCESLISIHGPQIIMKKIIVKMAAVAALMAGPAMAQETLWQNIETGMTVEQVTTLYPNARVRRDKVEIRDYRPLPNCPSTVVIQMTPNVSGIEVRGAGSLTGGCANEIRDALITRYGSPVDRDYDQNLFMGGVLGYVTQPTDSYYWLNDGVAMRFQIRENQGLMNPSWTMEYVPSSRVEAVLDRQRAVGL